MDNKVNYTVVGLFVIGLAAALVVIFLWLTALRHQKEYHTYVTYVRDEVAGLNIQSPVRYNGVKVGYVESIKLNPKDPQQVEIKLQIARGTPITTGTIATLSSEGITGIMYVGLKALTPSGAPLKKREGEPYPIIPSEPSLLLKMSTAVQKVTSSITALSEAVRKIVDEQNRVAIKKSLENIQKVTRALAENSQAISDSIQSAKKLLRNTADASESFPRVIQKLESTLSTVQQSARNFGNAGVTVKNTVQNIGPSAQQLMQRLDILTSNLQQLSSELRENPSILLRGKTTSAPGPGEH